MGSARDDIVERTRALVTACIGGALSSLGGRSRAELLAPGKMLRTRLAAHLAGAAPCRATPALEAACAATELVHTASLCHDDIIDGALMRRGRAALWRVDGATAAVLFGDMLLCEAFRLVASAAQGRHVRAFADRVREVCQAEAEQELMLGRPLEEAAYLRLARGMTGPLFAFPAGVCGGQDERLSAALEEAGYRTGTAYQVADDLLDVAGDQREAGKTLGTDACRRKSTLANSSPEGRQTARRRVVELCGSALDVLAPWPGVRGALGEFYAGDLQPVFGRCLQGLDVCAALNP